MKEKDTNYVAKEKFIEPEMEIIRFEVEDIIRTSGLSDDNFDSNGWD